MRGGSVREVVADQLDQALDLHRQRAARKRKKFHGVNLRAAPASRLICIKRDAPFGAKLAR
jgi:hypothetical protein